MNGSAVTVADGKIMTPEQVRTLRPDSSVWVTASAGAGKTEVLTNRVLRLLIDGTRPEAILCLTFTKAAAAEMATRIYDRLASFVQLEDTALATQLDTLKAATDHDTLKRARSLFATTLEAHGGLKIQTIHSFCQSLLARFPLEAGLLPGFATLDERSDSVLQRDAINALLTEVIEGKDNTAKTDLERLAGQIDDEGLIKTLSKLAGKLDTVANGNGFLIDSMEARLRDVLGLPLSISATEYIESVRTNGQLDMERVRHVAKVWRQCTGKRRQEAAAKIDRWIAAGEPYKHFDDFKSAFLTQKGICFAQSQIEESSAVKYDPNIYDTVLKIASELQNIKKTLALLNWLPVATAANRLAFRLSTTLSTYKQNNRLISFADLIDKTAKLLKNPMAAWVLYKLDNKIQHILVDEAQDTNEDQWRILDGLSSEFYVGQSSSEVVRTFFAVGDDKQSIFGFQGSEPDIFRQRGDAYALRTRQAGLAFDAVSLSLSFRSTWAVLKFVDANLKHLANENLGSLIDIPKHQANREAVPGEVILWPSINADQEDQVDALNDDPTPWRPPAERTLAKKIAAQIKAWTEGDEPISIDIRGKRQRVRAGDILVLVRRRSDLMAALVSELKSAGVPVAGVDRMVLTKQLAVMDVLACIRFVLQPHDDLMLATLLRSPFLGWDEESLFKLAHPRTKDQSLWSALRDSANNADDRHSAKATAWTLDLLNAADRAPPYEFLMTLLETMHGRANLLQRLGMEADDPITMLLDAALEYEQAHVPSLQGFLYWLDSSEQQIKRDPDAPLDQVRLMTVHGAKGLQAPVVIIADCCGWLNDLEKVVTVQAASQGERLPIWFARKENLAGPLEDEKQRDHAKEQAEYWRLWYVALTRAADRLYITGWHSKKKQPEEVITWYDIAKASFETMKAETIVNNRWGDTLRVSNGMFPDTVETPDNKLSRAAQAPMPLWATTPPPAEHLPPRPLQPSMLTSTETLLWDSPGGQMQSAARLRGQTLHTIFEIVPQLPAHERLTAARQIADRAGFADAEAIAASATALMSDPAFAEVFNENALVEVSISALLDNGQVLSGRIDRLVVTDTMVLCIDYKTNLTVPDSIANVPIAYRHQLAAYHSALSRIYTGLKVQTAILWTSQPKLMVLPTDILLEYHR